MTTMFAHFNRFTIEMTLAQAEEATVPGVDAGPAVRELSEEPRIARQLKRLKADDVRAELAEYGAWSEEELADDAENLQRLLWIAAGNVKEEAAEKSRNRRAS
jgi:hypothetical protein